MVFPSTKAVKQSFIWLCPDLRGKIVGVTRLCETCKRRRPLREFDLAVIHRAATCRLCYRESMAASSGSRREQLEVLERQRRTLIADLVKVDFEIAQLRGAPATFSPDEVAEPDTESSFGD